MKIKPFLIYIFIVAAKVSLACDSNQIRLDTNWAGPGPNTGFVIDFNCLDSNLTLHFADPIKISSVNTQGNNFFILTPALDTIHAYKTVSDTNIYGNDSTTLLRIAFAEPLFLNGNYFLVVGPDQQNIPVENVCGAKWLSDSIDVRVQDCFLAQLDIVSISNSSGSSLLLNWTTDTNSFPTYLFDNFSIYRKTPIDSNFVKIGTNNNISNLTFIDSVIPSGFIGFAEYFIALELNGIEVATSDTLSYYLVLRQSEDELFPLWMTSMTQWSVSISKEAHLDVLDMNGRLVHSQLLSNGRNTLELGELSSGIYIALIDGRYSRKLNRF